MKPLIYDYDHDDLKIIIKKMGLPAFKADQIFEWIYQKQVYDFFDMTNLSKAHQNMLDDAFDISLPQIVRKQFSKDGTQKYLIEYPDGNQVECVAMEYDYGISLCISSQVGCRMGCVFCASASLGLERNLSSGEMIGQILCVKKALQKEIPRVVVMGVGEPFDNYDALIRFIGIAQNFRGMNMGGRKITISTCGLVPQIYDFADLKLQVNLSISLHQPDDEKRTKIMPVNRKYDLVSLKKACEYYIAKTNRRISFEYALIPGVNDDKESALKLAKYLNNMLCYVNIIPINPTNSATVPNHGMQEKIHTFCDILRKQGLHITVRRELGSDIDAACGQLRRRFAR